MQSPRASGVAGSPHLHTELRLLGGIYSPGQGSQGLLVRMTFDRKPLSSPLWLLILRPSSNLRNLRCECRAKEKVKQILAMPFAKMPNWHGWVCGAPKTGR